VAHGVSLYSGTTHNLAYMLHVPSTSPWAPNIQGRTFLSVVYKVGQKSSDGLPCVLFGSTM